MRNYQTEFCNLAARFREIETQQSLDNLLAQAGRILLDAIKDGHFQQLSEWRQLQEANLPGKSQLAGREHYLRSVWTSFLILSSLLEDEAPTNPLGFNWQQPQKGLTVGTDPDLLSTARNSAEICQRLSDRLSDPWKRYPTTQAAKLFSVTSKTIRNWVESNPDLVQEVKKGWVLLNSEHPDYKSAINRKES
jgi:hypothetical protein